MMGRRGDTETRRLAYQNIGLGFVRTTFRCVTASPCHRVSPSPYFLFHNRPWKIFLKNLLITQSARRHHMRAFLTKTEPMTEAATSENEVRSRTTDVESRTLQNIPTEDPPDDNLEIPAANSLMTFTFERDEFCPTGVVALADQNLIQSVANIGS